MKNFTRILAVAVMAVFLLSGVSFAVSFSTGFTFNGDYQITGDYVTFSDSFNWGTSGLISQGTFLPGDDGKFSDTGIEYVKIATLDLTTDASYFNGFEVYDADNTLLFTSTLFADFGTSGTQAFLNNGFSMNLTGIEKGTSYTLGSSAIVDAFLNAPGGAMQLSLDIQSIAGKGSYSGAAAPVPEPATMLLLGSGLASLGIISRRRKKA